MYVFGQGPAAPSSFGTNTSKRPGTMSTFRSTSCTLKFSQISTGYALQGNIASERRPWIGLSYTEPRSNRVRALR